MKCQSSVIQRRAEEIFVVLSLLFYTGALIHHLPIDHPLARLVPILPFVIQTVTLFLIIARWKKVVRIVIREKLLWVLMSIALASVFYGDTPMLTLYRTSDIITDGAVGVLPLVQATLFGVYFGTRYSLNQQLHLLVWTFGISALLSLLLGLAFPRYGVMGVDNIKSLEDLAHIGAWEGVYEHKNKLGIYIDLSALVFFLCTTFSPKYPWVRWAGFSLSIGLILLSTSKSALVIFLTMMVLLPFYRALRWSYSLAVPFFISAIVLAGGVGTLLVANAETILAALGRDATLTGRTGIWSAVLDKIWERPWLGYGYQVFWQGWYGESADVWSSLRFDPPHAHDGFLDLWLDLGLLGLSVFALSFIAGYLRAVAWVRLTKNLEGLWPLVYLTFMLLINITESSLMRENALWVLYVAVTLSMYNKTELAYSTPK